MGPALHECVHDLPSAVLTRTRSPERDKRYTALRGRLTRVEQEILNGSSVAKRKTSFTDHSSGHSLTPRRTGRSSAKWQIKTTSNEAKERRNIHRFKQRLPFNRRSQVTFPTRRGEQTTGVPPERTYPNPTIGRQTLPRAPPRLSGPQGRRARTFRKGNRNLFNFPCSPIDHLLKVGLTRVTKDTGFTR